MSSSANSILPHCSPPAGSSPVSVGELSDCGSRFGMSQRLQIQLGADSSKFASVNYKLIPQEYRPSNRDCSPSLEGPKKGFGVRFQLQLNVRKCARSIDEENNNEANTLRHAVQGKGRPGPVGECDESVDERVEHHH